MALLRKSMFKVVHKMEISHKKLGKSRTIKGSSKQVVERKALAQFERWEKQWQNKLLKEQKRQNKEQTKLYQESMINKASELTDQRQNEINDLKNILNNCLENKVNISKDSFKNKLKFNIKKPIEPGLKSIPKKPKKPNEENYIPEITLLDKILRFKKNKKERIAKDLYQKAKNSYETKIVEWEDKKESIIKNNREIEDKYQIDLKNWQEEKIKFEKKQAIINEQIEEKFDRKDNDIIERYFNEVILKTNYPNIISKNFKVQYNSNDRSLILDFHLPSKKDLPNIKEVKYIKSRDEFKEKTLSKSDFRELYDDVLYQTSLLTINNLFNKDEMNFLDYIIYNGRVQTIDGATGHIIDPCLISVKVKKEDFLNINLDLVTPKDWFKENKTGGSIRMYKMVPVEPIKEI